MMRYFTITHPSDAKEYLVTNTFSSQDEPVDKLEVKTPKVEDPELVTDDERIFGKKESDNEA